MSLSNIHGFQATRFIVYIKTLPQRQKIQKNTNRKLKLYH